MRWSAVSHARPSTPLVLRSITGAGSPNVPVGVLRLVRKMSPPPFIPGARVKYSRLPSSEIHGLRSSLALSCSSVISWIAVDAIWTEPSIQCDQQSVAGLEPSIAASPAPASGPASMAASGGPPLPPWPPLSLEAAE